MSALDTISAQARAERRHIVLPEGTDSRILRAAGEAIHHGLAEISIIGERTRLEQAAREVKVSLGGIRLVDPMETTDRDTLADCLVEARRHKGLDREQALDNLRDPLTLACCMVRAGEADGCVAGAVHTTSDVVRAALQIIGMKEKGGLVSSFFIMEHHLPHQAIQGTAIFADCAMVIDPDAGQLARIAMDTADSAAAITGLSPRVALLSFSTAGSASHPLVDKVIQAGDIVSTQRPGLELMTEVQFDAAIIPEILERKAPNMNVPAPANVFIFPDLQSANIGYKIAQRIGGADAIGPVLQGLYRPVNDLSRGCSADDIVKLIAVTAVQSQ